MTSHHSIVLDSAGLQAPARARAWLSERARNFPDGLVQDALLVVSELVTNAVRHGRPTVVLHVEEGADCLVVEVTDGGDTLPQLPRIRPSAARPAGRGLLIVAATASDWGVRRTPGTAGKTVWALLNAATG